MIDDSDWARIQELVNRVTSERGEYFTQGVVVKRDESRRLVWLTEFGDQAIPLVAFDYEVKYYDTLETGNVKTRRTKLGPPKEVKLLVPKIGETVLIARHLGSPGLPKCLGIIQSTGYRALGE